MFFLLGFHTKHFANTDREALVIVGDLETAHNNVAL